MSLQRLLVFPRKEGKVRRPLEPESLRVSEPLLGGRAEGGGRGGDSVCGLPSPYLCIKIEILGEVMSLLILRLGKISVTNLRLWGGDPKT